MLPDVKGKHVSKDDLFADDAQAGWFAFEEHNPEACAKVGCTIGHVGDRVSILWVCVCPEGHMASVPLQVGPKEDHLWQWDGNKENPTITPSIQFLSGCKWHGFLTNGVWKTV